MPSTYSTSLRLELIGNGEQAGNWGNTNNINLGTLLEQAIAGVESVAISGTSYTLTTGNGVSDQARNAVIVLTGTLSANCNVIVPSVDKTYTFRNATTGGFSVVVKTAAGSGVTIANGYTQSVYCDATNVVASGAAFNSTTNDISGTNIISTGQFRAAAGTAAAPSLTFTGDPDTGIYNAGANDIGFAVGGVGVARLSAGAFSYLSGPNAVNLTTDGAIEITRNGGGGYIDIKNAAAEDADVRIFETGNGIGFQTGGNGALATRMVINSSGQIQSSSAGTAAAPAYSFAGDTDTGIYSVSSNALALSVGGVALFQIFNDPGQAITVLNNVPGQTFIPFYMRATDASASNFRLSTLQSQNENGIPLTALNFAVNTNGSGDFSLSVTPPGARTSDRRVDRMTIPGSGAINMVGPVNVTSGALQVGGNPVQIQRGTELATTSGAAIDFTGIPAGVRRITVLFNGVSTNGSSILLVQLGTSAGIASSGYTAGATSGTTHSSSSAGFPIAVNQTASAEIRGSLTIQNISGNNWVVSGSVWNGTFVSTANGSVGLAGVLDRIRLTATNGTDTFDAGAMNIMWEF